MRSLALLIGAKRHAPVTAAVHKYLARLRRVVEEEAAEEEAAGPGVRRPGALGSYLGERERGEEREERHEDARVEGAHVADGAAARWPCASASGGMLAWFGAKLPRSYKRTVLGEAHGDGR